MHRKFATYKTSTGLVGLAVDPEGRTTLNTLAGQILSSVKVGIESFVVSGFMQIIKFINFPLQRIPSCQYRENVEKWFEFISKVTTEKMDVTSSLIFSLSVTYPFSIYNCYQIKEIENEINLGQIEEVIEMAKDEMSLVDYYYGTQEEILFVFQLWY